MAIVAVELRFATIEVGVQVDHERELAAFAILATETAAANHHQKAVMEGLLATPCP
jgi:hypothetical protein